MLQFGNLGSKSLKTNVRFEITPLKQGTHEISLSLEDGYFLTQKAHIWEFGLKIFKNQCQISN